MKFILVLFCVSILFTNCNSNKITQVSQNEEIKNIRNIYFSEIELDYSSHAVTYSHLTKDLNIVDEKNHLDEKTLQKIKSLDIFPDSTMNFINSYNDTINVVFSLPKRKCLCDNFSDYLFNFSTTVQYVIIDATNSILIDSLKISHETGIVPPIDCVDKPDWMKPKGEIK